MEFKILQKSAKELRELFKEFESKKYGRPWTTQEVMLGFLGDVGDLAKLVQGASGIRDIPDLQTKIGHELADCLGAVLVIADEL